MIKEIELNIFNTTLTVAQAAERGKEFMEAVDTGRMINTMIFDQTENKTSKQIGYIIGDIRRFCNSIEHELLVTRLKKIKAEEEENE